MSHMSSLASGVSARSRPAPARPLAVLAGVALAAALAVLARRIAPDAPMIFALSPAALAAAAVTALALLMENHFLGKLARAALCGAALALFAVFLDSPEARLRLFAFTTAGLSAWLALWLFRTAPRRPRLSIDLAALYALAAAALSAYAAAIVVLSRDLMIADFMTYRGVSIEVARLAHARDWPLLVTAAIESIVEDYSWAPALAPGLALALTAPFSRAVYTFALISLYAAPAAMALAVLARDLARRAGLRRDGARAAAILAFGMAAAVAAYPAGMAVVARGMPDIGGLALVVVAIRLAERLARLVALSKGQEARVARMTRRVAIALGLVLFAMFAFRRWYAFAAAGLVVALALELALAWMRAGRLRWREALAATALGALVLLALVMPVVVDWLPNLGAHDYGSAYAAYRKPPQVLLDQLGDWVGLLPALCALASAAFLWAHSKDRRLLRLTLGQAAVAAFLFLRIQTPYIHHLDLIAPAIAAPVAAALMIGLGRAPKAAFATLIGLALVTLSPLARTLNAIDLAPVAGLPRAPRADLADLERLKDWVDARARPDAKVCGLGSSYTFSGQLIGELWQLHPERQVLERRSKTDVTMSDVDTVDGPPAAGLKDCAIMIVGDPVQTHLDPRYQQTVVVPSREMLSGQGIGASFCARERFSTWRKA